MVGPPCPSTRLDPAPRIRRALLPVYLWSSESSAAVRSSNVSTVGTATSIQPRPPSLVINGVGRVPGLFVSLVNRAALQNQLTMPVPVLDRRAADVRGVAGLGGVERPSTVATASCSDPPCKPDVGYASKFIKKSGSTGVCSVLATVHKG